jgi:hypothetical protein
MSNQKLYIKGQNYIGGAVVSVLASKVIGRELREGHIKDYQISICCFSTKHAALRRKSQDWIMCVSGATCLPADCCFSELVL